MTPKLSRVLVCGGRDYADWQRVWVELDELQPAIVITGGASGADQHAQRWCNRKGIPCMVFPAAWDSDLGRGAGPTRNMWMIVHGQPELVVAFPGGKGTANMVAQARARAIEVRIVEKA